MALSEQEIVPYAAAELRGEKLLILAPHPDDEVIGCGGLIALHTREKRQVRVLIATDGTAATADQIDEEYRLRRERESITGLAELGGPTPRFLRFKDRQLSSVSSDLQQILQSEILDFSPDLIAVPSPIEVHPDHVALTRALIELIQADEDLIGELAVCRVAFYEVSQPIQPNALVDITACADLKYQALAHHASQKEIRDYEWFARGLNQYRSMTLFPASRYAEAYFVVDASKLRTESWSRLARDVGGYSRAEVTAEPVPISVVIRTKNRPQWLRQAVDSVRANDYPASIIVVNDGGASPEDLGDESLEVIDHSEPIGRSEAMNAGVRQARAPYIAFLDDDDLYYHDHLKTLASAAQSSAQAAFYTDAISTFHEPAEDGTFRESARLRLFAQDFDRELLLLDNYIPLPTLLVSRDDFLKVGGFNPEFDLLEDWDFLIRLSKRGPFLRIPRVTCEIRHFRGGDSAILISPEESPRFRAAKLKIWAANKKEMTPDTLANVFEKQKRRLTRLFGEAVEKKGLAKHLEREVTRLDREKTILLEELQNEGRLRGEVETDLYAVRGTVQHLEKALEEAGSQLQAFSGHIQGLQSAINAKDQGLAEKDQLIKSLFGEIKRLNDLLNLIYKSKTWKLHQFFERIRRRGE